MSVIGELLLKISGDSRGLEKATAKGKKALTGFESHVKGVAGTLKTLGGLFAGAAIARWTLSLTRSDDALSKLSRSIGVSTEFLSQMHFAADRSGVELAAFDTAMRALSKRAGEFAATGGGPAAKAIKLMGTEFEELVKSGASAEELLPKIADHVAGLADSGQKLFVLDAFLSEVGRKMVPLVEGGARGIAALRNEADDLGYTLSTKAGKDAEAFNDALTNLGASIRGSATAIIRDLTPGLRDLFVELRTGVEVLKGPVSDAWNAFRSTLQSIGEEIGYLYAKMENFGAFAASAQAAGRASQRAFAETAADANLGKHGPGLDALHAARGGETFGPGTPVFGPSEPGAIGVTPAIGEALGGFADQIPDLERDLVGLLDNVKSVGGEVAATVGDAWGLLSRKATEANQTTQQTTEATAGAMASSFSGVSMSIGQALSSTLIQGADFSQAMLGILNNVVGQMIGSLLTMATSAMGFDMARMTTGVVAAEGERGGIVGVLIALAAIGGLVAATMASASKSQGAAQGRLSAPSLDTGGELLASGLVMAHAGERILNEREVRRTRPGRELGLAGLTQVIQVLLDGDVLARATVRGLRPALQVEGVLR
jgi:hypothetical protein